MHRRETSRPRFEQIFACRSVETPIIIIGAKARNVRVVPSRRRELEVVARYCAPVIDDKKESSPRSLLLRTRPICINETGKSALRKNISTKGSLKLNCISKGSAIPDGSSFAAGDFSCLESQLSHFVINKPFSLHFSCH